MSKHKEPKRTPAPKKEQTQPHKRSTREIIRDYTLIDCMKLGFIGNLLFVVFIVICLIYYYSLAKFGKFVIPYEVVAYTVEVMGFMLFILSVIWMDKLMRARTLLKILLPVYICIEVLLMLLEFDLLPFIPYNGLSLALIVTHAIGSAAAAFSLIQLEPQNKRVQIIVAVTVCICLAGMLPGIAGLRVYSSVLINAFAYIFFFLTMHRQLVSEEVTVDCHGDRAKVTSFSTTMFSDSPLLEEKPKKERRSVRQLAQNAADRLTGEEQVVLTDTDEKFEYEFGVQDDDDDEYDEDEYDDDDEYDEDEDDGGDEDGGEDA